MIGTCQYRMGMLVMRACGSPAMSACSFCGLPLCVAHAMSGASVTSPACPSCAASNRGYERNDETEYAEQRDASYKEYGGTASYGQDNYFSPDELTAMNVPLKERRKRLAEEEEDYDSADS